MSSDSDFELDGGFVRSGFDDQSWQVTASPVVLDRVFDQVVTRRRRRRAAIVTGAMLGIATLTLTAAVAVNGTRHRGDGSLAPAAASGRPTGTVSAVRGGAVLPAEAVQVLTDTPQHERVAGPFTGSLVSTTSAGERIYLARAATGQICIIIVETATNSSTTGTSCEAGDRVITTGVFLYSGNGPTAVGILAVPDGYTSVTSDGSSTPVTNNVAIIHGMHQKLTMAGPGFESTTVDLGNLSTPE